MSESPVCQVAVAVPLHRSFEYLWPFELPVPAGRLVQVPFGNRKLYGLTLGAGSGAVDAARLKPVSRQVEHCTMPADLLELTRWCAAYYHHPIGEVAATALPSAMAQPTRREPLWQMTDSGKAALDEGLARGARQRQALTLLAEAACRSTDLRAAGIASAVERRLADLGWIEAGAAPPAQATARATGGGPELTADQTAAVEAVQSHIGHFSSYLLHGVTGSGKTEVYLALIEALMREDGQALVIVPEIGLTPQLRQRFESRLGDAVGVMHSQMSDGARAQTWRRAAAGELAVVLGTRSAVFCPLKKPRLIVVDEEHDLSFKQHEGFRYSARDVAVQRARLHGIPIVLGSATPSLESLANSDRHRYQYLRLASRPGAARMPALRLIDLRGCQDADGLAAQTMQAVRQHLERGQQVLVFLNRRGFAPVLLCNACGWSADCPRCDTRMTLHLAARRLHCHHCATARPMPDSCPQCRSTRLLPLGIGTQRLEQRLARDFDDYPIWRVDRDTTRYAERLPEVLEAVGSGVAGLLVGTQMLAKGHDFPGVTLVVVANLDQALYSSDFRSTERTAQLMVQVAGRAGRGAHAGEVLIQTHHPEHPLFHRVLENGYLTYARELLVERRAAGYPPFGHMALIRAESHSVQDSDRFLTEALTLAPAQPEVELLGPLPAPMARRAGRHRMQLLLNAPSRRPLHALLSHWLPQLAELKSGRRVRWSVDVDPQDLF